MNLVALLTPDNKLLKATYPKLRNICIKECLKEENIEEFMEFQKEYSYFEPYFDFMFFSKKIFIIESFICRIFSTWRKKWRIILGKNYRNRL